MTFFFLIWSTHYLYAEINIRLDDILIKAALRDPAAQEFWTTSFGTKRSDHKIEWAEFIDFLCEFLNIPTPYDAKNTEVDKLPPNYWRNLACLKHILCMCWPHIEFITSVYECQCICMIHLNTCTHLWSSYTRFCQRRGKGQSGHRAVWSGGLVVRTPQVHQGLVHVRPYSLRDGKEARVFFIIVIMMVMTMMMIAPPSPLPSNILHYHQEIIYNMYVRVCIMTMLYTFICIMKEISTCSQWLFRC